MGSVFAMHVGCLIDDHSPACDYNKRNIKIVTDFLNDHELDYNMYLPRKRKRLMVNT